MEYLDIDMKINKKYWSGKYINNYCKAGACLASFFAGFIYGFNYKVIAMLAGITVLLYILDVVFEVKTNEDE